MSQRRGVEERAEREVRRYEERRLVKTKRSDEFEVIEEVFDRFTLETLFELMRGEIIEEIHGVVKTGKEARIYWGLDPQGRELAIKIYYTLTADFRQGMLKYIEGDYRFRRVRKSPRGLIYAWAQKEFRNLKEAHKAGVRVPEPVEVKNNILVMEFIGEKGKSAPLLREVYLNEPEKVYNKLLDEVNLLYRKAELVHGDLSEYNIMFWEGEPVIFDVSQAVPTNHPLAEELLLRDLSNLNRFFSSLDVKVVDIDEVNRWITRGDESLR